jgi:ABC-type amino acid transport substrate-binding protein
MDRMPVRARHVLSLSIAWPAVALALALTLTLTLVMTPGLGLRPAAAETLRLTTQEWPPYQVVERGALGGSAVAVVECALARIGAGYEITVYPWRRAQQMVRDGGADGFFAASQSAERDGYAVFSTPVAPQVWRWFWRGDRTIDLTDRTARVGVIAGSRMHDWLRDNGYTGIEPMESTEAILRLIQLGRVDAVLANDMVFSHALTAIGGKESGFASSVHSDRPLGVYFARRFLDRHPGFLDRFNAASEACQPQH